MLGLTASSGDTVLSEALSGRRKDFHLKEFFHPSRNPGQNRVRP
jgi:hypothetical protein